MAFGACSGPGSGTSGPRTGSGPDRPWPPPPLAEALVSGELVEPPATDLADQPHRVVTAGIPQSGIDLLEDVLGLRVPRPAQVAAEVTEGGQGVGKDRADRETSNRTHASRR